MKIQHITKVLIVTASITCISYTAQAQSAGVRAAGRSGAAHSVAEQVRRESNHTHCYQPIPQRYYPGGNAGLAEPGARRRLMHCVTFRH